MRRKVMMATGAVAIAVGVFLFAGGTDKDVPTENETINIKQLVNEYTTGTIDNQSASITSQQLIVTNADKKQITYDLPKDEFFVSIAPYVENTHPCAIHSLTGCQGEITEGEFQVLVEDKDGSVILDQTVKSQSNGFIDLWLPRDKKYNITIEHDGKTAKSELSTFESDDTCVTTMQLVKSI